MFEKASRLHIRFQYKGPCPTEDLWIIPIEAVDTIYKALNKEAKTVKEESLLATRSAENEILNLKIDIVKHVVKVRLAEMAEKVNAVKVAGEKQELLGIINDKKNEEKKNMPIEDLEKMYNAL